MRLTTGQARTRVLGMTFRPGPSPLGGPRPNSTKDGGERGQPPEKILARTRGKGTTPGFEGQAGSYIMAQKRTVGGSHSGAVTPGQSLRGSHSGAVTPGQSLRGSHSGAVTSGQSLHSSRLTPVVSDTLRDCSSHCRCPVANSPRRHNVSVIEVCSILPCQPPPPLLSDRPTMHCQY